MNLFPQIIASTKAGVAIDIEHDHCILTLPQSDTDLQACINNYQLKIENGEGYVPNHENDGEEWIPASSEYMSRFFKPKGNSNK